MVVRLAIVIALITGAGCSRSEQPAPPLGGSAVPSSPAHPSPSSSSTAEAASAEFDWAQRVGPPRYLQLPNDPRGDWVPRGLLSEGGVLVSLIPSATASDTQRAEFISELGRFEPQSGTVQRLVRHAQGRQAVQPIVAGRNVAWIEATPSDLRAYGWSIHLTDVHTGEDRVVARDSGFHPEGVSVLPSMAYDGTQLVFTRAAEGGTEPLWELHRLTDEGEQVVATLPRVRDQRFLALAADAKVVAWIENVTNPDPHTSVGVYDLERRTIASRARTGLSAVYQTALSDTHVYFATGLGVFESDRGLSYEPRRFSPESSSVDQIVILGEYLIYRNFDSAQTVAALELTTRAHARIAANSTFGPVGYERTVLWFERLSPSTPARLGLISR